MFIQFKIEMASHHDIEKMALTLHQPFVAPSNACTFTNTKQLMDLCWGEGTSAFLLSKRERCEWETDQWKR